MAISAKFSWMRCLPLNRCISAKKFAMLIFVSMLASSCTYGFHLESRKNTKFSSLTRNYFSLSLKSNTQMRNSISMLWSGGQRTQPDQVTVNIERPTMNSRRISGSIIVDRPIDDVWLVLTDYDKLSDYVPNLTQSKLVPHPNGGIRLFQEGAQKIVGFDFRASLVMDMEENSGDPDDKLAMKRIKFRLVDSSMFAEFSGEWRLQFNSRIKNPKFGTENANFGMDRYTYSTKIFYMVNIKPKGVVPVMALEWQISEEVPKNLSAIKKTTERMESDFFESRINARKKSAMKESTASALLQNRNTSNSNQDSGWERDETLEAYIQNLVSKK